MKRFSLAFILLLSATPALAQQPRPDIVYASAADIQALIAKASAEPPKPNVLETIVNLSPYRANLEYRAMTAPAALHETEAELMVVLDGAATLVVGGTMTEPQRSNPTNLAGTAIVGGTSQAVAKGDFMFVPQNTPHQLKDVKGVLVLMTFHVPRPFPGSAETSPLPDKTYVSAGDVQAALATARAAPPRPIVSEQLVDLTPYRVQLEYNNVKGNAAVHDTQAELMYVIDGAGDFLMGGALTNEKRNNPANRSGSGIEGGTTYHLAKGDVIFVSEGTPHQVTAMAPGGLTLMTIHPPRPVPKE